MKIQTHSPYSSYSFTYILYFIQYIIHFTLSMHKNFLTLIFFSSLDPFLLLLFFSFAFHFACMCILVFALYGHVWFIPITQCTSDPFGFKWLCNIFCSLNTYTHAHRTIPIQIIEWICIGTGTKLQLGLFNQI